MARSTVQVIVDKAYVDTVLVKHSLLIPSDAHPEVRKRILGVIDFIDRQAMWAEIIEQTSEQFQTTINYACSSVFSVNEDSLKRALMYHKVDEAELEATILGMVKAIAAELSTEHS